MSTKSFTHLVVRSQFGDYQRGDVIDDAEKMSEVLATHEHAVIKSSEPYDHEAEEKKAKEAEAEEARKAKAEQKRLEKQESPHQGGARSTDNK